MYLIAVAMMVPEVYLSISPQWDYTPCICMTTGQVGAGGNAYEYLLHTHASRGIFLNSFLSEII